MLPPQSEIEREFRQSALRSFDRRKAAHEADLDRIVAKGHRSATWALAVVIALLVIAFLLLLKVAFG